MRILVAVAFVLTLFALTHATRTSCSCDCKEIDDAGSEDSSGISSSNNKNEIQYTAQYPQNCDEAVGESQLSGIYEIQIRNSSITPFFIHCQTDPNGGPAWAIVQRRQDGSIDFYRNWIHYKNGFGNIAGEYFIGLDRLHALTHAAINELWIEMKDFEGETRNAYYDSFAVGNEANNFPLYLLGKYSGNAGGDSLRSHQGEMWSTKDVNNDRNTQGYNFAEKYRGAWWYRNGHYSNLNGLYLNGNYAKDKFAQGINWEAWHGFYYSLKYTHMAIRWKVV